MRTRATALALVNWRGVFYERYLLDPHVTALEGANGAGKTTVMIAAYVVLLPDLSRLRFTNLGESGASGGDRGIWGRLGETGRPSYAAFDLTLGDGSRMVVGVRLRRKAEPTVEATPFIVTGLGEAALQDLLLVRQLDEDHVPELDEVRGNCRRLGATLEVFRSSKDYFAALFERGVSPLRLASDEDKNKLNEMLRTSMTGGISRALTSELRSFLLKEETGLSDTLSRMRSNLETARRSRSEVAEARVLEREITGVYEAGAAMFAASWRLLRSQAEAARAASLAAEQALRAGEDARVALATTVAGHAGTVAETQRRLDAARKAVQTAVAARQRQQRAAALAAALASIDAELGERHRAAIAAQAGLAAIDSERAEQRVAHEAARDAYDRAARGLAHLQEGLDELHRRANTYRRAQQRLEAARNLLEQPSLTADDAVATLARLTERCARIDQQRARIDSELATASARHSDYDAASAAFARIETRLRAVPLGDSAQISAHSNEQLAATSQGSPAPTPQPSEHGESALHTRARGQLATLAAHEAAVARSKPLEAELREARALFDRQRHVRQHAATLGLAVGRAGSAEALTQRLSELEAAWIAATEEAHAHARRADDHERAAVAADIERRTLEDRSARWKSAVQATERLAEALGTAIAELEHGEITKRLAREHAAAVARHAALIDEREDALRRAAALDGSGGDLPSELLRLRDELGGELLAARFEELDLATAAQLEARLGPLAAAIVVEDPEAAARELALRGIEPTSVWLIAAGASVTALDEHSEPTSGTVIVRESESLRVTTVPSTPTLGRRARQERAAALRAHAKALATELDEALGQMHELASLRRDLADIGDDALLGSEDPNVALATCLQLLDEARQSAGGCRRDAELQRARSATLRGELDALRQLHADALLLDPPDYSERAERLAAELLVARQSRALLADVATDRQLLSERIDALRAPPPSTTTLAAERASLAAERDRVFAAREALEELLAHRHALTWSDAQRAVDERANVVPALEEQHAAARSAVDLAVQALAVSDQTWQAAALALQSCEAERASAVAARERLAAELAALGEMHSDAADVEAAEAKARQLEAEILAVAEAGARDRQRLEHAEARVRELHEDAAAANRAATPAKFAWNALRDACTAHQLVPPASQDLGRPAELAAEATTQRELLLERLARARGGSELAAQLTQLAAGNPKVGAPARTSSSDDSTLTLIATADALPTGGDAPPSGNDETPPNAVDAVIEAWLLVRDWLRRRVPAAVADTGDALLALERLREHLAVLESRLGRQEADLRAAATDITRGIEVQLRRASWQVRRLSEHLEGISFGSIGAIRVQMQRVERMDQILAALREGDAQELLFQSSLPIEEALEEIFRRYGGGRSGGQRLLDYREYLHLTVEIRRRSAESWEPANATRLSTGEAIGVGAALMMVVLTEWERDANLLRARRTGGSLRFLFLDEANRLSRDNLAVLFELCRHLDLQLLIAAPEVAQAEGNTTYRLVRRLRDDGGEEVWVTGRRARDRRHSEEDSPAEPLSPAKSDEPIAAFDSEIDHAAERQLDEPSQPR